MRDPVLEWRELSRLYEEVDSLADPARRREWLDRLPDAQRRHVPSLLRMLEARAEVSRADFMRDLPSLDIGRDEVRATWQAGDRFGAWRLLRHVGSGGMADVWLAERADGAFDRDVALKLLHAHPSPARRQAFEERFRRERDILAALHHPNIAALHDAGVTAQGQPWLALAFVQGRSLVAWCDERALPLERRIEVFLQALAAVEYAHAHLVVHRDLKPANILVDDAGHVSLLDFGIAKLAEVDGAAVDETDLTRASGRPLTLRYASPEQIAGRPLSVASDIYSLGVVLHELVCGQSPYVGLSDAALLYGMETGSLTLMPPSRAPPSEESAQRFGLAPKALRSRLRPDLDAIVTRALEHVPGRRYESVAAMRDDLLRWSRHEPVEATVPGPFYRSGKFVRRHPRAVALSVAAGAALLVASGVSWVQRRQALEEAALAAATKSYLLELFRWSDPVNTRGARAAPQDMLDAAMSRADAMVGDRPALLADVLTSLAELDAGWGRYARADATLRRVADLRRRLGQDREWAMTQLQLASNALQMGDAPAAQRHRAAGAATMERFASDLPLRAKREEVDGWIARESGRLDDALRHFAAAFDASVSAYGADDRRTADVLRWIADAQAATGEFDAARRAIGEAARVFGKIANATPLEKVEVRIDRAKIEFNAGNDRLALPMLVEAREACEISLGPQHEDCVFASSLLALIFLQGQGFDQALALVPTLLEESRNDGSPRRQTEATILVADILGARGRLSSQPDILKRLEALPAQTDATSDSVRHWARLTIARNALREGRHDDVARMLNDALHSAADGPEPRLFRAQSLELIAHSLQMRGRTAEAAESFERVEADYAALRGSRHISVLKCRAYRAVSMLVSRRTAEGRALLDETLPLLRDRLFAGAPFVSKLDALRAGRLAPQPRGKPATAGTAVIFE